MGSLEKVLIWVVTYRLAMGFFVKIFRAWQTAEYYCRDIIGFEITYDCH